MTRARTAPSVLTLAAWIVGCGSAAEAARPTETATAPSSTPLATEGRQVVLDAASRRFVEVATVDAQPVTARVAAPGRIAFRDAAVARIGAPLTGRIQAVHVRIGEVVPAGAPLFTIGSADAAGMRAELASARTRVAAAQEEVRRQRGLVEAGVGLASERVRAEAELAQAETELARAKVASRLIGRGPGGEVVVSAPIAGTVLSRRATPGTVAEPGDAPLVELGDPTDLWVVVDVFEDELALVQPDARAEILTSGQAQPATARVIGIAGAIDDRTRRAPVVLALDPVPPHARAGMFVRARIETPADGHPSLPAAAVLIGDGGRTSVWLATDDEHRFEAREVVVGRAVEGRVPILAGLAAGDRVVVDNALLLDAAADQLL